MNKYLGLVLALLAVVALVPRLIAETKGISLVAPVLLVLWGLGTLMFNYLQGKYSKKSRKN